MTAALAAAFVVAFSPSPSHFGQIVTATVQGAGTPSFAPFAVLARHGDVYEVQCLDPVCVPGPGVRVLKIGGRRLSIVPRTTAREVSAPLRSFERQTAIQAPTYRLRPSVLRALLVAAALVLAAVGAFAAWPFLHRLAPRASDERTPLERALAFVRESLRLGPEERRRALDLLGRSLGPGETAQRAFELAWSEPSPDPSRVESLVETAERET
ncbi:MAG TPA: hypothetical protein VHV52_02705 [Gaiellaceae bacterium]|nr:hypothetical protein [Gaiellaceae bacterium]